MRETQPRAATTRSAPVVAYSVGEVAQLSGLSVRTLHHFDQIGVLKPGERSENGYRRYSQADLERLQRLLVYRELGFPLKEISALLGASTPKAGLERQLRLMQAQAERTQAIIHALRAAIAADEKGQAVNPKDLFEGFDNSQYEAEAKERWGETDAYRENARRTGRYSREDWARIAAETEAVEAGLAALMGAGEPASGAAATDLAERHRRHIDGSYYPCSLEMHAGLADMYVGDPRFAAHYDRRAPGLAQYVSDAIHANAARRA